MKWRLYVLAMEPTWHLRSLWGTLARMLRVKKIIRLYRHFLSGTKQPQPKTNWPVCVLVSENAPFVSIPSIPYIIRCLTHIDIYHVSFRHVWSCIFSFVVEDKIVVFLAPYASSKKIKLVWSSNTLATALAIWSNRDAVPVGSGERKEWRKEKEKKRKKYMKWFAELAILHTWTICQRNLNTWMSRQWNRCGFGFREVKWTILIVESDLLPGFTVQGWSLDNNDSSGQMGLFRFQIEILTYGCFPNIQLTTWVFLDFSISKCHNNI